MCGIFVSAILSTQHNNNELFDKFQHISSELHAVNALRGPDAQRSCTLKVGVKQHALDRVAYHLNDGVFLDTDPHLLLELHASELRLRGDSPVIPPHVKNGNIFCWNGEIFEGLEIAPEENDGTKFFEILCSLNTPEQIRDALNSLEGPYAFVFFHAGSQKLYFARDPLGRRSLLIHKPSRELPYLLLSSVSVGQNPAYDFSELSTRNIFCLDVELLRSHVNILDGFERAFAQVPRLPSIANPTHGCFVETGQVNKEIPPHDLVLPISLDEIPGYLTSAVDDLIQHLDQSVMFRVRNIPRYPMRMERARVAILFSGGIDSTVITYLAHRHIPLDEPIDLLNVAFENPRKIRIQREGNTGGVSSRRRSKINKEGSASANDYKSYQVPDRMTGITEVEELRRLCPGRTWNFVEINVPYEECQAARPLVEALMVPGRTVMDLSLALALYFASRGKGQVRHMPDAIPVPYASEARVLLNGLGSDELLGGYGRHRSVYNTGGWEAVISELQLEIERIPTRNLGRDDRVISSHGKETRHPFLSLSLVSFVTSLPIQYKMDPRLDVGFGDKMLLRLAARKLGLVEASSRKKRAMQFGSHSARMDGERRGDVQLVDGGRLTPP